MPEALQDSYREVFKSMIEKLGMASMADLPMTAEHLHDPLSPQTCLMMYLYSMEPHFVTEYDSLNTFKDKQLAENLEPFVAVIREIICKAEVNRIDRVPTQTEQMFLVYGATKLTIEQLE